MFRNRSSKLAGEVVTVSPMTPVEGGVREEISNG